jgi:hypothetical protein
MPPSSRRQPLTFQTSYLRITSSRITLATKLLS